MYEHALHEFDSPEMSSHMPGESPFWGGWLGYISYEAGLGTIGVDPSYPDATKQQPPDVNMVFVHRSVVIDHLKSCCYIQSVLPQDDVWVEDVSNKIERLAANLEGSHLLTEAAARERKKLNRELLETKVTRPDKREYCDKVRACQETLAAETLMSSA